MIPDKVEHTMQKTFTQIENGQVSRRNHKADRIGGRRLRTAAAVAVTALAIGTTAYAAAKHSAILDYFAQYDNGRDIPEQAKELIQTDVAQEKGQSGVVNFNVREALCDKHNIIVAVEAKPADLDKYLIVPEDMQSEEDLNCMTMENLNPELSEKDMTVADYAKKYNKEVLPVGVSIDTGSGECSIGYTLEEDGTGVFTCQSENVSKKTEMNLSCYTGIFYHDDVIKNTFQFKVSDHSRAVKTVTYRAASSQPVEGTNFVIDEVKFEESAIGIKSIITYHYAGDVNKITESDEDIGFYLFGEDGKQLKDGAGMAGGSTKNENGVFTQSDSLALTKLPDKLTLLAKDVMTKEKFGKVTVHRADE